MQIDAKEALTKGEKARQEGDGVGNNVMQLGPGESKEIQQEGMRRKRKTPIDVREKKHALISPRARFDLTWTREATPIARKQTVILIATDFLRRNNGRHPLPRGHGALEIREKEACRRGCTQRSPEQNARIWRSTGGGKQGAEVRLEEEERSVVAEGEVLIDAKGGPAPISAHLMEASVAVPQI